MFNFFWELVHQKQIYLLFSFTYRTIAPVWVGSFNLTPMKIVLSLKNSL